MDIRDILKKHGVEIAEDKIDEFNKDFRTHYKSAAEHKKVKDDLVAAQDRISKNTDFEGQYNTLFRKYKTDLAAKQAEIDGLTLNAKLEKELSGFEFINGRVRESVLGEIKEKGFKIADNGNIEGLNDYLKDLQKNEPDIFKSKSSLGSTWVGGSDNKTPEKASTSIFGKLI